MPGSLLDSNVWLAAMFSAHAAHDVARDFLRSTSVSEPAVFCRATEQSFLRLSTTPAILKAYGASGLTNQDALIALNAFRSRPETVERDEPAGTATLWHRLATRDSASPKIWMDAYLAAFAISGSLRLVTLDKDFETYRTEGLELKLLQI